MKKLNVLQMENLLASGRNRDCMIVGGLTMVGTALGTIGGPLAGAGALIGGLMTGASMGCFS